LTRKGSAARARIEDTAAWRAFELLNKNKSWKKSKMVRDFSWCCNWNSKFLEQASGCRLGLRRLN